MANSETEPLSNSVERAPDAEQAASAENGGQNGAPLPVERSFLAKRLYLLVGWVSAALAILGAALPLLPTTPFLLLAAACFGRSSPKLHRRLLDHPRLGPFLRQWNQDRSVSRGAKRRAYGLVLVSFGFSIWAVDRWQLSLLLAVIGTALLVFLKSLRTSEVEEIDLDQYR